jgi:2-dehydro-3-deoxyphosphogalactonate aldolase
MPLRIDAAPIVAILRGVTPDEVVDVANVLVESGIRAIEVPLNSPEPLKSIERLARVHGERCACGAGTVLNAQQVDAVHAAGGTLIVSPNTNASVISRAVSLGIDVMPGFATATEAFTAMAAGARHLKLFPAATYGPAHVKALRAVLPTDVRLYAVGGVSAGNISTWLEAGIAGIGAGTDVYQPGRALTDIAARAAALVAAFRSHTAAK